MAGVDLIAEVNLNNTQIPYSAMDSTRLLVNNQKIKANRRCLLMM